MDQHARQQGGCPGGERSESVSLLGGRDWVSLRHTKIEADLNLSHIWIAPPVSASDPLLAGWGVTGEVMNLGGCNSSFPWVLMGVPIVLPSLAAFLRQIPVLRCVWVCISRSAKGFHKKLTFMRGNLLLVGKIGWNQNNRQPRTQWSKFYSQDLPNFRHTPAEEQATLTYLATGCKRRFRRHLWLRQ